MADYTPARFDLEVRFQMSDLIRRAGDLRDSNGDLIHAPETVASLHEKVKASYDRALRDKEEGPLFYSPGGRGEAFYVPIDNLPNMGGFCEGIDFFDNMPPASAEFKENLIRVMQEAGWDADLEATPEEFSLLADTFIGLHTREAGTPFENLFEDIQEMLDRALCHWVIEVFICSFEF